jgi:hypothetical protein
MNPNQIEGLINEDEIRKLQEWAGQYESIVEVGSWKGRSTAALCSTCNGKVYAVDNFKGSESHWDMTYNADSKAVEAAFRENTKDLKNLEFLKMDSVEAAKKFEPKSIDMVFIDAGHEEENFKADMKAWLPIAKKFICGHDLYFGGVKKVLDELKIKYQSVGFNYPLCLWFAEVAQ